MTSPEITEILEELAAGRIDAAEAARRIDALKTTPAAPAAEPTNEELAARSGASPTEEGAWAAATDRPQYASYTKERVGSAEANAAEAKADEAEEPEPPKRSKPVNTQGVERLSVRAIGRRVRIIGETSVATVSADGPHVLRRNGSVLEVSSDGEMGSSLDGFSILRAPRNLDDIRSLGLGKELFLRVNPNLIVDVEVTAGSLNTERVPHLGKIRVTAGGAKLLDVAEINDALIQAGQATIKGAITTGRSRVRAESGSLVLHLSDESNVTVKGDAQLGKVSWTGGHSGPGDEVVMGNGSAKLDIEVVMGHAMIRVGSDGDTWTKD
ncbi:hypothetical protein [Microlunatus parietis]|uniref:Adhesin domain-containing protein n=1 Tax=Microlunatus parietis TaxID=682979 RepID=A0A7Y9I508_9ACTN|nr:hypothetical protein [Microlunatus parietis]NYE70402.1 hypothetical protein [Microlunatus parietis]